MGQEPPIEICFCDLLVLLNSQSQPFFSMNLERHLIGILKLSLVPILYVLLKYIVPTSSEEYSSFLTNRMHSHPLLQQFLQSPSVPLSRVVNKLGLRWQTSLI